MWKTRASIALIVAALSTAPAAADDSAKKVVDEASMAMGVAGLNSITYS